MVTQLSSTTGGKFQSLADELNKYSQIIAQGEQQFGILGIVAKVEDMLKAMLRQKFGLNTTFINDKQGSNYIQNLSVSSHPALVLRRRFTLDLIKAAKQGDVRNVINKFKSELYNVVKSVRSGNDPFDENYVIFEIEGGDSTCSQGTLASFRGGLPVANLSLVDQEDADKAYIAQEVKKNHFILKPTAEQLRQACINALYNKGLSEHELRRYLNIARTGKIKILKEHINETANYSYKTFGDKITLSPIRTRRR